MEGNFNEWPMDPINDIDISCMLPSSSLMASMIPFSPSCVSPSPETSLIPFSPSRVPPSPEPGFSLWDFSDGNYEGNYSLVPSPPRLPSWPSEKTFHPEREGEMEADFNEMLRSCYMDFDNSLMLLSPRTKAPSPEASSSRNFLPSNLSNSYFGKDQRFASEALVPCVDVAGAPAFGGFWK